MHCVTFTFKVLFTTVPPAQIRGGYPCFFVSLCWIGLFTFFINEIATILGCLLGIPKIITAITFVALGTSVPDLFASKTAAIAEETADDSVGNVTGSNSVNVFLGLGLPWLMACIAQASKVSIVKRSHKIQTSTSIKNCIKIAQVLLHFRVKPSRYPKKLLTVLRSVWLFMQ